MIDHPEFYGILHDILVAPADDGLRLLSADWLEDNGFEDRAIFVRLQVAHRICHCSKLKCKNCAANLACSILLDGHGPSWVGGDYGWDGVDAHTTDHGFEMTTLGSHVWQWSRGYPSCLNMELAEFRREDMTRLFSAHPVTSVFFNSFHPQLREYGGGDDRWCWYADYFHLHPILWHTMISLYKPVEPTQCLEFGTTVKARQFLSTAAVCVGRGWAGLPPLQ